MRDVVWRIGLTLTALTGLVILGPGLSCGSGHRLIEQATGQTPQAQIAAYMAAIARGDRRAALAAWTISDPSNTDLKTRRESMTDALLASGPHIEYGIEDIEWWRTCCEPAEIQDPDQAGGASVRVSIKARSQPDTIHIFESLQKRGVGMCAGEKAARTHPHFPRLFEKIYIFDILVPGGYWGEAMGNPVRHWTIVDVYPETEAPLAWTVREW